MDALVALSERAGTVVSSEESEAAHRVPVAPGAPFLAHDNLGHVNVLRFSAHPTGKQEKMHKHRRGAGGWVWGRRVTLGAIACIVLGACASLVGPREIAISRDTLQAGVERRFPLNNRALDLLDIELSHPRLSLQAGSDRVALSMDALVAPPFLKQSWRGSLALSGRLVVDAARGAVFMSEPRVEQFSIEGMDEARQRQLEKIANMLMHKVVGDVPVYRFRPDDLRYGGVQFVPSGIRATDQALLVRVEPAR